MITKDQLDKIDHEIAKLEEETDNGTFTDQDLEWLNMLFQGLVGSTDLHE